MRNRLLATLAFLSVIPGLAGPAPAVELQSVQFPERRTVELTFAPMEGAPRARIVAEVTYRDGQARIELGYEDLKPAILYAGDVTCYVVWAVTRGGNAENLGELFADEPRGRLDYLTAKKEFALLVTAEPFYLVSRPSGLAQFANRPSRDKRAPSTPFVFDRLEPAPKHAMDSIENIAWDSRTPLPLLQARKAYELAGRYDASKHAPQIWQEAGAALAAADELEKKSPGSRKLLDNARRAVALSNEAINISLRRIEGIELERQIAERRAEMESLERRAAEAERQVADARRETDALREERDRMAAETAALQAEKAGLETAMIDLREERNALEQVTRRLQQEKTDLGSRLQDALSHVAETRNSARGFVVNLPDILFDVNKATLKPEARLVLAKLAGILLIIRELGVTVEGHTDSTGSAAYNLELSQQRAQSVLDFLVTEGVDASRLEAVGFGMTRPVADNETAEGRSKNRRVEIVVSER